ncbi:MAG: glycosyltransferase [Candidatus Hinthialibacter antarcticus]|nr:glycosyltransferase [Candidatus Hinthialibacter antarcticus]
MKIVFVNHTFPPHSMAGSELCVLRLAQDLQRRGHETVVFYRIADETLDELALVEGEFEGVSTCAINHTYRFARKFQDIYLNPILAARFAHWLRQQNADVVHFHHLTNLSLSLVQEAKAVGLPVVLTLHDYWLLCQRGQLLRRDLSLCDGPGDAKCRACLSTQLLRGPAQRYASAFIGRALSGSNSRLIVDGLDIRKAQIHTPNANFVARTSFQFDGQLGDALLMHPPAEVRYRLKLNSPAHFVSSIALHPDVYQKPGGGVWFFVERNGETLLKQWLNPKENEEDQGWHEVAIDLPPSESAHDELVLKTIAENEDAQFCSAGWKAPRVESLTPAPTKAHAVSGWKKRLFTLAADAIVHLSAQAREGISHRKHWAQRVMNGADLLVSPSHFLADFFIQHGAPKYKLIVSDNGFPDAPAAAPRTTGTPLRFGYIGTWIPSKGVHLLLEAFQTIDPADAVLHVYGFFPGYAGYEQYEDELRALAGPAVEMMGRYQPEDAYSIVGGFDCLVVPSIWWENSPMTIHEGLQMRVPVLTADVGGMAEQVQQGGGLTFRHRDAGDLRRVIESLIQRPQRLDALRESAPAVKSSSEHADELAQRYEQLIQQRNAS